MNAGIQPDKVTLSALLLLICDAADVQRVPLPYLAHLILQVQAVNDGDANDDDDEPEEKCSAH